MKKKPVVVDTLCFLVTLPDVDDNLALAQLLRDFAEHIVNNGLKHSHFETDAGEIQQLV